jgi:hypothetical protein
VDLVDEQDVARFEIGQDGGQIAGLGQDRPRGGAEADAQFLRHDLRQRRLAQPRRAEQQDVVQRLAARARRVDEDLQIALGLLLPDELGQGLRPQRPVIGLARRRLRRDDAVVGHRPSSCSPARITADRSASSPRRIRA